MQEENERIINYGNFGESPLGRLQARRLLSDYAYWYQLILRGLIFLIPMAAILVIAIILSILDAQRM